MEAQEREEGVETLEQELLAQLNHLEEEVNINIQVRNETNSKIREMVESLNTELEKKIENE